jgi:hypothetical protein
VLLLRAFGIGTESVIFYGTLPVAAVVGMLAARAMPDMPARTPWLVGAGWVALVQGDFFFLGAGSRLEWGDGNELFWTYFPYLAANRDAAFLHLLAGGVGAHSVGRIGGEFLSWRIWLAGHLPLWIVAIALRFAVTAVAFAGAYLAARDIAKSDRRIAIAAACIFSVGYDVTATMTFLYGLSIAALPLIYWALWCLRPSPRTVTAFVAGACIYVTGSDPFYWLPTFWIVGTALAMLVRPVDWRACFGGAVVLSVLWVLNFLPAISAMIAFIPFSSRVADGGAIDAWTRIVHLAGWTFAPIAGYNRGGWPMFAALVLACLAGLRTQGSVRRVAPLLLALGLFSAVIRQLPFQSFGLGFLTTYNWYVEYGAFAFAAIATALSASALAGFGADAAVRERRTALLAGLLLAGAVGQASVMRIAVLLDSYYRGGIARASEIPNLVRPDWYAGPEWRAISVGGYPFANTPVNHGIATYDATATLFAARLHHYWNDGILRGALPLASLEVHVPPDWAFWFGGEPRRLADKADLSLLQAANVRYVISGVPLRDPELRQISAPPPNMPAGPSAPTSLLDIRDAARRQALRAPPPVFGDELADATPRVYVAREIVRVPDDMSPDVFPLVARTVAARGAVLDARMAEGFQPGTGTVETVEFRPNGFAVALDGEAGGTVIVNTPYVPFWHAKSGTQTLAIAPANVAQIAVRVPPGVRRFELVYGARR